MAYKEDKSFQPNVLGWSWNLDYDVTTVWKDKKNLKECSKFWKFWSVQAHVGKAIKLPTLRSSSISKPEDLERDSRPYWACLTIDNKTKNINGNFLWKDSK